MPFLWAIQAQEGLGRFYLGLAGGALANGLIFYWYWEMFPHFSKLSTTGLFVSSTALYLYQGLVWALFAFFTPLLMKRSAHRWLYSVPCLMVTLESCLPQLFPYPQGASHYQVTTLFQVVSLTGIYGMTFLLLWSNCLLFEGLRQIHTHKRWPVPQSLLFLSVVGMLLLYGSQRKAQYKKARTKARVLKLGLIQPGLSNTQWSALKKDEIHQQYISLSHDAIGQDAEWILWPESAFRLGLLDQPIPAQLLLQEAEQLGVPLLVGGSGIKRTPSGTKQTNSARHAVFGVGLGKVYNKIRLVPFGEYQPWKDVLGPLYTKLGINDRVAPGTQLLVESLNGVRYSFLICYEAIFQDLAREAASKGAQLLINPVNDRPFGQTTAPHQHLMLAAIRSAELGIPMARVTTTGISTTIDSLGRMGRQTRLFQKSSAVHTVALINLGSLYKKTGNIFAWLCTCLTLLFTACIYLQCFSKKA